MEAVSGNTFIKSFSARPFPDEVFPHLTLRSCISEASESLNGPRYAAQDKKTFDVYEVRYTPFELPPSRDQRTKAGHVSLDPEDPASMAVTAAWQRQEERMSQLLQAKERHLPYVCFPYSVFVFDEGDGKCGVASVEDYAGLSLGDIVRSGWTLVEENLLTDVLEAVEAFGRLCPLLPPHGNLSADAVKQLMTVREVTVEAVGRSRWVVGDWLLTDLGSSDNPYQHDFESCIGDLEWMLQSTFSQFRIQSDATDDFLTPSVVESRIEDMMTRLREELKHRYSHFPPMMCLGSTSILEDILKPYRPVESGTETQMEQQRKTQYMGIKEKIAFHQAAQRDEQQLLNRYRRRHALLPPRPHPPGELANYSALEDEVYIPAKPLRSPLQVRPSSFFSMRTDEQQQFCSADNEEGEIFRSPSRSDEALAVVSRSEVIDDIVHLAVLYEDRVGNERKAVEEEIREQREALRNVLVRSATLATRGRRSASSINNGVGRKSFEGRCRTPLNTRTAGTASGRDDLGGGTNFHFSPHGPSHSPVLHSSSPQQRRIDHSDGAVSSTGTSTPNPNSRRRTLTDISSSSSRPQTARRTNPSGSDPKGPLTPGSAVSQGGQSILFPTYGSSNANNNNNNNNSNNNNTINNPSSSSKDIVSLNSSGKNQITIPTLSKRKETPSVTGSGGAGSSPVSHPGVGSVNFSESSMNHITPLPLNSLPQQSVMMMGGDFPVNVPPQHSVRGGSPQSNSNVDLAVSEFPAAPQSITIGETVPPPRRPARSTARYETWTYSRSAPGMNSSDGPMSARRNPGNGSGVSTPSSVGGSASKFLAKKLLRSSNTGDIGTRTTSSNATSGLTKNTATSTTSSKSVRSHVDPVLKNRVPKTVSAGPALAVTTSPATSVPTGTSSPSPTTPGVTGGGTVTASQGGAPGVGRQSTISATMNSASPAATATARTGRVPSDTVEGVTRGSIRTVTGSSVVVPKTPR